MSFLDKLKSDYALVFSGSWPVWIGGLLIGVMNVIMFSAGNPWSTLDGVLNWGDNLGISRGAVPLSVLEREGSLLNFGLIFGAFLAALLSKQFGIRVGPVAELIKGLLGGILIGIGAVLVRGCNIGGFFSGTSAMGMHGLIMAIGLMIGAFIGARYLLWEMMRDGPSLMPEKLKNINIDLGKYLPESLRNRDLQPYFGLVIGLIVLVAVLLYYQGDLLSLTIWIGFGVLLGIISQRSRLCMVHAFREPFITGDASHTKAVLLGLAVSIIGFSVIKADVFAGREGDFVRPTFWQGSLVGGIIFGVGMVLAGGCGGGMMWRVGEGHVKLLFALVGYVVSAGLFDDFLLNTMITNADGKEVNLLSLMGQEMFLPDVVGWSWALLIVFGIMVAWYLLIQWNEISHRFAAM